MHGMPVQSQGMLVVVALVLLNEEAQFDSPALGRARVAALMDMIVAERLAGEPGVARCFSDGSGLFIDRLPAFLTAHPRAAWSR